MPPRCDRPARRALGVALALVLAPAATGCGATRLDMASAYDAGRAATTIPYASVRGSRQFADYEAISGSILTGADPAAATPSKAGKPKGGAK